MQANPTMTNNTKQLPAADIAIVGGGMVGVPLAIMLSQQGWRVALIERQQTRETQSLKDAQLSESLSKQRLLNQRCTALSAGSQQFLQAQGLWQHVATDACPINEVHVSHKGYFGSTRLKASEHGVKALGYVVNNSAMLEGLRGALAQSEVSCLSGYEAYAVNVNENDATLSLRHRNERYSLQAKLTIAVDGISSFLREAAGIAVDHHDYDQCGVLGTVQLERDHQHVAYERFTTSGPLAMLPRPNNMASFVWCVEPTQQEALEQLSDSDFLQQLQRSFGYRLGKFQAIGARQFIPLIRTEARRQTDERLILLGNAARLLHPVAGQGYNLALRDVAGLSAKLKECAPTQALNPPNLFNAAFMQSFVDARSNDQKQVLQLTDTLARSFRGKATIPAHARSLALLGLEFMPVLKNKFARTTMGFR